MKLEHILEQMQPHDNFDDGSTPAPAPERGASFNTDNNRPKLKYKDLTSLQLHYLNKLASGKLDLNDENLSDNVWEALTELQTLGLLGPDYELTDSGNKAVEIFNKLGGHDLATARERQAKLGYLNDRDPSAVDDVDDVDDFDDSSNELDDDDFENDRPNRFNA